MMHNRVLYKRASKFYILEGKTQLNGKIKVVDFPIKGTDLSENELANPFRVSPRKINKRNARLVGVCETEEKAYDMIDYYLEMTIIISDVSV